jgi:YHS domain-containing protein
METDLRAVANAATIGRMIKRFIVFMAVGPLAVVLIGCGQSPEPETAAVAETIPSTLPGNICVVSEEELGSMGAIVEYDYNGNTIQFCCKHCIPEFKRHTEQYVAALKTGEPVDQ